MRQHILQTADSTHEHPYDLNFLILCPIPKGSTGKLCRMVDEWDKDYEFLIA